ncbi:hypothetical protein VT98_13152 [Candidatus Electrothrix communis]|uniref:Uncharacterized protein n=1 Tax=Candidatus Electrothrix communis TaxID=1859133 RepID=A0A3S3SM00_9BACT|nr:hypothetical protein VT98_13152 [Candidatus Electrothrix communis]
MREGAASRTNRESEDLSENLNGYLVDKDNRTIRGKTGTPRINIFGPGIFFAFFFGMLRMGTGACASALLP